MNRIRTGVVRTLALVLCICSAPANAADQILTPDGLAPVQIGMTVEQAEAALGAKLAPLDTADGYSSEACWETQRFGDPDPAILYMIWHGKIVRIDITRYEHKPYWTDENVPAKKASISATATMRRPKPTDRRPFLRTPSARDRMTTTPLSLRRTNSAALSLRYGTTTSTECALV
ncbi:MAG: hypothetical protein ACYCZX_05515 [Rhodospirillaceae bacterium]